MSSIKILLAIAVFITSMLTQAEDSVSFLPVLRGEKVDDTQRGIIYHSDSGYYSIAQGKWKLVLHRAGGTRRLNPKDSNNPVKNAGDIQLFNMESDPTERDSVHARNPEKVAGLQRLLAESLSVAEVHKV